MTETNKADQAINYQCVLNGKIGIGHRPKLKSLSEFKENGVTHLLTLLCEKEGALSIKKATLAQGLSWIWLPLQNANPPEKDRTEDITAIFAQIKTELEKSAKIFIHCSAGIHRTGMISYAFLRYLAFSQSDALNLLKNLRPLTGQEVGEHRIAWGNETFAQIDR